MEPYNEFQANSDKPIPWKTYPYPAGTYEMTNYIIEDKGRLPAYVGFLVFFEFNNIEII